MKYLERTRPPGEAVLRLHVTLTRAAISGPHITPEHLQAATSPRIEVVHSAALPELAIAELSV